MPNHLTITIPAAAADLLPGRDEQYNFVMSYRVLLLREERQEQERCGCKLFTVDYNRQRAVVLLEMEPGQLDSSQRNTLPPLAVSLHELGEIQREQG